MANVGIGSKSSLAYVVETTYGVAPVSNPVATEIPIVSENIQNSRTTFLSKEVNPTRQITSVRSGNIAAQGDFDVQVSPNLHGTMLKHLLTTTDTVTVITPVPLTNSAVVGRGSYVTSNSRIYLVVRDGTASATAGGSGATGLQTIDQSEEVSGTAYFQYVGVVIQALAISVVAVTTPWGMTSTAHGLVGAFPAFVGGTGLPAPTVAGTLYWGSVKDANTITLFDTYAHALGAVGVGTGTGQVQFTTAGTAVTLTVPNTIYQHVFTGGVTKPVGGLYVERQAFLASGSQYFRYSGGRLNTLNLKVPQEGYVTGKFGTVFLNLDSTSASTIFSGSNLLPSDEAFDGAEALLYIQSPTGVGAFTADFSLESLDLTISNQYDEKVYAIGSRIRQDLPEGMREVKGNLTCFFEDMVKFGQYVGETTVALRLNFNHRGCLMQIDMPMVRLVGGQPSPTVSGNGVMKQTFDFQAFNQGGAYDIQVTLLNTTATYV